MIDLKINEQQMKRSAQRCRERNIVIPTIEQQKYPEKIPAEILNDLKTIGLWDVNPRNLFRITWKNQPTPKGGLFGGVNFIELPKELTGVSARIIALVGKWFPTGSHKVGATFGCLVPRLITGQFDPTRQKAVWPSTGNYCRGGAYDAALLACESIAILPEGMSRERFEWLKTVAGEIIATPGCESNVKEIYDKCWELKKNRDNIVIFNQFDEFGNYLWHYEVTGQAMEEVVGQVSRPGSRVSGVVLTTGSAGTIASGDYIKKVFPGAKIAVSEALQCPTLLLNGYGGHRIEGIGDKHVPWIHNVKNTDMIIAIDDEDAMNILPLFNLPEGKSYLTKSGVSEKIVSQLDLVGISGIANILSSIKFAKYYELTENDIVLTVLTDSMEMYDSRVKEYVEKYGGYSESWAERDFSRHILGIKTDVMQELSYVERRRIHNLKYYTWIEQQGRDVRELNDQWYDDEYWDKIRRMTPQIDERIRVFNELVKN
ncbi:MAG: pyridoxal-5-phosphate-dependent protein subunit beta [Candidatus Marinimicrobia bacterium CG08_land_8_20_14_0_20_45_22]|nr:MAG: pyridoxal-5-phosphate-dependent protein subunit beta [Candidatus Marinimicrobia bacterium CG08_land_8_20_14_0_20_45_22]